MKSEFARRLRHLREGKGISRRVLADLCGVSESTIMRYEQGKRIPNLDHAAKIADEFEVTIDFLYGR